MKILYYDCFSGISGDMNLGAMIDLGVDSNYFLSELKKLNINEYSVEFVADQRKGITGTRAIVKIESHHEHSHGSAGHNHNHSHSHNPSGRLQNLKSKDFTLSNGDEHPHHVHGRNFSDIKLLLQKSGLSDKVKVLSINIFRRIAEAEAKIHGKSVDEVHFHEVGAVDSIVDIVGAAICIDYLKPDKIFASAIELGGGFVKCAHGTFPVPAPATTEILKGIPVKLGAVNKETTTPTGAAILAELVDEFKDNPDLKILKIAYGIGYNDNPIPNVLRVFLAESEKQADSGLQTASAEVIECNIDDMNPEMYEYIMEKLFDAGADDVYFQPIIMKKTRPAVTVCVLCKPSLVQNMEKILLSETSSLGIRKYRVNKSMLHRDTKDLQTKWGIVKIKYAKNKGETIKWKPEYEDCINIARTNNIPLREIYREINKLMLSENHKNID
jgi:uncharacterized protein (TIGR00299 family) protein